MNDFNIVCKRSTFDSSRFSCFCCLFISWLALKFPAECNPFSLLFFDRLRCVIKFFQGSFPLLLSLVIFSQILSGNFYRFHLRHFFKHFKLSFVAVSRQNFNVRCFLKSSLGENRYISQVEHLLLFFILNYILFLKDLSLEFRYSKTVIVSFQWITKI